MATAPPIDSATLAVAPRSQFAAKAAPISQAEMARRDAMKAIARDIPNPAMFAWHLPEPYCFWLIEAWKAQDPKNCGCLTVGRDRALPMFSLGLCDRDGYLTVFGMQVRRAMQEQAS